MGDFWRQICPSHQEHMKLDRQAESCCEMLAELLPYTVTMKNGNADYPPSRYVDEQIRTGLV
jgi:hypothetical protein